MKKLVLLAGLVAALVVPAAASAHALGNFTINRFSRVEVSGPRVYVRYVLDLAEIPTFQAGHIDAQAYAARIARNARLELDGRPACSPPACRPRAGPAAGGRWPEDPAASGGLRRAGARPGDRDHLPRHQPRRPDRLEGDRRPR